VIRAIEKAKAVYLEYGNDLDGLLTSLDIEVLEVPLKGRLKEIFFGDHIVLKAGLSPLEKRELTAHALGHHFMHAGSHYAAAKKIYTFSNYHEKQAEVFAAYLLIPEHKLEKVLYEDVPVLEVAEQFEVRPEFAKFRVKLHNTQNHKAYI